MVFSRTLQFASLTRATFHSVRLISAEQQGSRFSTETDSAYKNFTARTMKKGSLLSKRTPMNSNELT